MKVVELFKQRGELISKHQAALMEKMSPAVREYWEEFLTKTNNFHFFAWIKDFHQPAVNEEPLDINETIGLSPEALKLYNQLQDKIGEVIHVGEWMTIDQERIDKFGMVTEDTQWIHMNPERARDESPFKTTIAHGFLTLALLPKLTDSVDPKSPLFPSAKMTVNIGLNQVRFPYPIKCGDTIRAKSTLTKVTPVRKGLEIEREVRIEIEGVRRPGCVVTSVVQLHF